MAVVFGVPLKAVDMWWAKWEAGGWDALVMRPRGKPVGVHQVLGEAEQAAVRQAVLDHRPCDVGLGGQLWTRRLVGELITKLYRVRLTGPGVGKYLKRPYLVGGLDGPVVRSRGPETPGMAFKRLPSMVCPTWPPGVSRRLGR
ncbi:winged helix-turn-helix domain-containing protein [Streptomyces sp. NPDC057557]|uniref:winged helix-turn-helix domain-containing protein n=1 Tax=Streptomyces sp. NPDC057557 TaxID=3346167 RepID=UPI00368A2842